jgi:hypothetical protein
MPIYEIKHFSGGLSDWEDRGVTGAFKFGKNLDIRKQIDSLTCAQDLEEEGLHSSRSPSASTSPSSSSSRSPSPSPSKSVSPTPSPSASASPSVSTSLSPSPTPSRSVSLSPSASAGFDTTTIFQDLIRWFVKASDGYTYGFGSTGYIYRRDSSAFWQIVYKDENGEIKGAAEKPSSNGKTYLYWATDRVLKRKDIAGLSNWNDVETVNNNLDSADWHTMIQINGGLHIANRANLALVGYDDSYTNEALNLIPGNLAKTLVERDGRSITGTYRASDPTKGINGAIDAEVPLAQVGDDGQIIFADMNSSMPAKRFPGGGKVNPGGVCNFIDQVNFFEWEDTALSWIDKQSVGNLALFAVWGADTDRGGIYSYGRTDKNKPFTLNLDHQLDADELGAIITVSGTILVSYRDGSDFGVKAVDPDNKAEAAYEGLDFKSPVKNPVNITHWKYVEVFCKPMPANTWVEFWYKINKYGDFVRAPMEGGSYQFSTANEKKAVFFISAEGEIFEPRVVLHPYANTTPEVHRLRVYFE